MLDAVIYWHCPIGNLTSFQIGMNFKWLTDSSGERSCRRKMII